MCNLIKLHFTDFILWDQFSGCFSINAWVFFSKAEDEKSILGLAEFGTWIARVVQKVFLWGVDNRKLGQVRDKMSWLVFRTVLRLQRWVKQLGKGCENSQNHATQTKHFCRLLTSAATVRSRAIITGAAASRRILYLTPSAASLTCWAEDFLSAPWRSDSA